MCGPIYYPPKYGVSGSELLKRDFFQLKDTLGNLFVQASQALPRHKTGYEMPHYSAPSSSACVAYKMNFNDNFDIFYRSRKVFQKDEVHWSSLGVKVQYNNLICGLQKNPLKFCMALKLWHMDLRAHQCKYEVLSNKKTAGPLLYYMPWTLPELSYGSTPAHRFFSFYSSILLICQLLIYLFVTIYPFWLWLSFAQKWNIRGLAIPR